MKVDGLVKGNKIENSCLISSCYALTLSSFGYLLVLNSSKELVDGLIEGVEETISDLKR